MLVQNNKNNQHDTNHSSYQFQKRLMSYNILKDINLNKSLQQCCLIQNIHPCMFNNLIQKNFNMLNNLMDINNKYYWEKHQSSIHLDIPIHKFLKFQIIKEICHLHKLYIQYFHHFNRLNSQNDSQSIIYKSNLHTNLNQCKWFNITLFL